MDKFKKKNLLQLRKLSVRELEDYYSEYRKYQYNNEIPLKRIKLRKKIHLLCLAIVKIDRILSKEKIELLSDERIKTSRPKIYASNHIGGNDIQRAFEAIKDHAYLFVGDLGEMYRNEYGMLVNMNGAICLNTRDKEDRKISKERTIELLNKGGDILIFPEGAWNITPNEPIMELYPGIISIAQETEAEIIPIAQELINDTTYVKIGKNLDVCNKKGRNEKELLKDLRNYLATLRWEIWETQPVEKRANIKDNINGYQEKIINILNFGEGYQIEDVNKTRYKDINHPSPEEVFSYIKKLK